MLPCLKHHIKFLLVSSLCVSLPAAHIYAQETVVVNRGLAPAVQTYEQVKSPHRRTVSDIVWKQLTNDKAFSYRNEKELAPQKQETREPENNFLIWLLETLFSDTGRKVLWTVFFCILVFALYKIFIGEKTFLFGRKKKTIVTSGTEEVVDEDILDVNWEQRLEAAVHSGDMRLAVRCSYMWLLQLLQEKGLIRYRMDKTNYDYIAELGDTAYKQQFRQIMRQYEFSWYGHYPLSSMAYEEFKQQFLVLKNQLGRI